MLFIVIIYAILTQAHLIGGFIVMHWYSNKWLFMKFPERLTELRKERGFTQQSLADSVDVHVSQIRRYEGGQTQPTLDVIRKLAISLGTSADMLVLIKTRENLERN